MNAIFTLYVMHFQVKRGGAALQKCRWGRGLFDDVITPVNKIIFKNCGSQWNDVLISRS